MHLGLVHVEQDGVNRTRGIRRMSMFENSKLLIILPEASLGGQRDQTADEKSKMNWTSGKSNFHRCLDPDRFLQCEA